MPVRIVPLATIVVIAVAGLGRIIWHPEGLFNRHSDLVAAHLNTQNLFHQSWQAEHRVPLWRSDILSGQPALTNPQAMFTHPVHLLFAYFPPERIVGLVLWLHLLVGALGAYYMGAVLGLSVAARTLVAVTTLFSFKTILMLYAGNLGIVVGVSALPLLMGAAGATIKRPTLQAASLLGGAGALALHAGHLQVTYYALLFIAMYVVTSAVQLSLQGHRAAAWRATRTFVLGVSIAFGLSAYVLMPLVTGTELSTRAAATFDFFLHGTPSSGAHLLTFFDPELLGTPLDGSFVEGWEYIAFVGGVTSLFALVGIVESRRCPTAAVLSMGLAISVVLALNTPLLELMFRVVPGYGMFRLPTRILFLSAFFICCLSGIGLDRVLAAAKAASSRMLVTTMAIGLVSLEGGFWAQRYLDTPQPMTPAPRSDYAEWLRSQHTPFRIAPLSAATPDDGTSAAYGLQMTTGYDPFVMRHYRTYIELVERNDTIPARTEVWTEISAVARPDLLAALNVLYVVSPAAVDLPSDDYELVKRFDAQPQFRFYQGMASGPVYVYRNRRFLPRAFFARNVIVATDEASMVSAIKQNDVRETAIVFEDAGDGPSFPHPDDKVTVVRSSAGALSLETTSSSRRFVVVSEVWHPGWSATVDGRAAKLERSDVALLGLWLEPGRHSVELRFWPPGLSAGLLVSGLTLTGVLFMVISVGVHRRHRRGPNP